ncbi:hypothetical protein, partial [Pseudoflavonifractor sp. HCP28S3_F10]|uniref:hypothetical protein n=1 Tax=Pseudoflavonifractor sp. HCP28S3_F10 TaxID=3438947 RepID=UPI003F8AB474
GVWGKKKHGTTPNIEIFNLRFFFLTAGKKKKQTPPAARAPAPPPLFPVWRKNQRQESHPVWEFRNRTWAWPPADEMWSLLTTTQQVQREVRRR